MDANFVVNPQLTAIAVGYKNEDVDLIADQVMPRVPVAETFKWTLYDPTLGYTVPDTQIGRGGEPNIVTFNGTDQTASVVDQGLDNPIPMRDIQAFADMPKPPSGGGPIDPVTLGTMLLSALVDLAREVRVAAIVGNPANYSAANQETLSGSSQWSDYTNSDPLSDLLEALDMPLIRPNTLTISRPVYTVLRQHPKIVQAVFKTNQAAGKVQASQIADLLEIKNVLIGESRINTARPGQTASMARVWGNFASLTYTSASAAQTFMPVWGWTGAWGGKFAADFFDPKAGLKGSQRIRVGEQLLEIVAAPASGYLIQSPIAT